SWPRLGDLTEGTEVDFGIDRRRRQVTMPQHLAYLDDGGALAQHLRGQCMPEAVGSEGRNAGPFAGTACYLADQGWKDCVPRGLGGQEDLANRRRGADATEILAQGLTDIPG